MRILEFILISFYYLYSSYLWCLPRGLCLALTSSRSFVLCCSVVFRTCWYSFSFCSSSSNNLQGAAHPLNGSYSYIHSRLLFHFGVFMETCTGWFPVSASPAVRSVDDVSADGPESGRTGARWRRCRGRLPPLNLQHEGLRREQTPPPLHPPRLPSLRLHTRTTDRSGSAVLQKERKKD